MNEELQKKFREFAVKGFGELLMMIFNQIPEVQLAIFMMSDKEICAALRAMAVYIEMSDASKKLSREEKQQAFAEAVKFEMAESEPGFKGGN
jgi:hypothetical protein